MSDHHDIKKEVRKYLIVFAALGVLTVVTVAISYLHVPFAIGVTLALLVATVKASLVAGYFMHLIDERKTIYLILGFTVFFFFGLLLLPMLEGKSLPHGTVHPKGGRATITAHAVHGAESSHSAEVGGDKEAHEDNHGGHSH